MKGGAVRGNSSFCLLYLKLSIVVGGQGVTADLKIPVSLSIPTSLSISLNIPVPFHLFEYVSCQERT